MKQKGFFQKKSDSGFSLIEIVIVLFLTGLVLFMVSGLISRTLETLKFLQEKSQTLESATLGCERLASELREAVEIITPIPSGKVTFKKVKPSIGSPATLTPVAVGNDLSALPETWGARKYPSSQLGTVTYEVDSQSRLLRKVDGVDTLVATDVNSFAVTPRSADNDSFLVRLSLQEKRRVIVFEMVVNCPALQRGYTAP